MFDDLRWWVQNWWRRREWMGVRWVEPTATFPPTPEDLEKARLMRGLTSEERAQLYGGSLRNATDEERARYVGLGAQNALKPTASPVVSDTSPPSAPSRSTR